MLCMLFTRNSKNIKLFLSLVIFLFKQNFLENYFEITYCIGSCNSLLNRKLKPPIHKITVTLVCKFIAYTVTMPLPFG